MTHVLAYLVLVGVVFGAKATYRSRTLQLLPGHFEFCKPGQDCWRQLAGFETTARPLVLAPSFSEALKRYLPLF